MNLQPNSPPGPNITGITGYIWILAIGWTMVIAGLLAWNLWQTHNALTLGLLWLLGFGGIVIGGRNLDRRIGERNQAVAGLQQAHDLLHQERDLFVSGPVVVFKWQNRANWPVDYVSANVKEILGYTAAEFLQGKVLYAGIVHPEDISRVANEVTTHSQNHIERFEHQPYRLIHQNGDVVWVLDYTTILRDDVGNITHYLGYLVDITELKKAEEALRASEERLKLVLKGTELGTWDWNVPTGEVVFNERWAEMLGYTLAEIEPNVSSWEKLLHPDEISAVMAVMTDHLEGRTPIYQTEHRLRAKSGEWKWILDTGKVLVRDEQGNPIRAAGTHRDITERKQAEETLRISEERFALAVRGSNDGVWDWDLVNNTLYWSPRLKELLGYADDELEVSFDTYNALLHPDDKVRVDQAIEAHLKDRAPYAVEQRHRAKGGEYRWFLDRGQAIWDENGRPVRMVGSTTDITARKRAEEALRESEKKFSSIVESSPMGMHLYTLEPDGKLIFTGANPAADRILGVDNKQFIGKTIEENFPPLAETEIPARYREAASLGKGWQTEQVIYEYGKISGVFEVHAFQTSPGKMVAMFQDVTERKQAEEMRATILEQFKALIGNLQMGVLVETANREIIHTNQSFCDLFGIPAPEVILGADCDAAAQGASALFQDPPGFVERINNILAAGQVVVNEELYLKEGRIFERDYVPVYIRGNFIGNMWLYRDITERKQVEEALQESEARNRAILNAQPDLMFVQSRDGTYLDYYAANEDALYVSPEQFLGKKMQDIFPEEFAATFLDLIEQVAVTGKMQIYEYQLPLAGQLRYFEARIVPYGEDKVLSIIREITERKQAEQTILEAEQRLRSLINSTPDIICFKDGQGRWLEANTADLELFSLTEVNYRGKTDAELAEFTDPIYRPAFLTCEATDEKAWQAGGISRGEEIIPKPDGAEKIYDVIKVPIFDADGRRQGLVVLGRDITDRKQMEQRLVQQERLAAVGQLAAGIAHDFNNILTGILGFAELLQTSPETPESMQSSLQKISASSRRAAHLVRQLLDFSRKSIRRPKQFALDAFTQESVEFFKRTIPENIQITLQIAPGDYLIEADPTQLQQVITNLVVNARDAMPSGGKLELGLSRFETAGEEKCAICGRPITGAWFGLTVADSGSGIAAEVLPHIFEPFFTTKEVGEGTGLGLSQVYGIISQHHGHITVNSQVDQGTTITVYLPPAPKQNGERAEESPPLMRSRRGETILLVEDDPTVLEIVKAMLEQLNYRVITAFNGRKALAVYREHQAEIALVLSDMMMPDMAGEALFQALKTENPDLKMVLMSGYPLGEQGAALLAQGVVAWFEKPMSFGQLSQVVSQALSPGKGRWGF